MEIKFFKFDGCPTAPKAFEKLETLPKVFIMKS